MGVPDGVLAQGVQVHPLAEPGGGSVHTGLVPQRLDFLAEGDGTLGAVLLAQAIGTAGAVGRGGQCDATDAEMRQFLKKYKIGTERRCHVIDDQSNIAMVEAGLGISIMPQMLLRDCKAAVKVYPIEPEEYRVVGLAVQRPASMAPAVEQMFHHIVDYCRQLELPL